MTDSFFSIHFYRRHSSLKKIIAALFTFAVIFSTAGHTFAHTHVESTNPADGETITEPLSEITLTFEGQIEQGSTVELIDENNEAIEFNSISVADGVMTGTLAEPLENGSYIVRWSSISADGHPMEGEFTFAVETPATEEAAEETGTAEDEAAPITEENNEEETETSSFPSGMFSIALLLVLLIVAGAFFLLKRKR